MLFCAAHLCGVACKLCLISSDMGLMQSDVWGVLGHSGIGHCTMNRGNEVQACEGFQCVPLFRLHDSPLCSVSPLL